MKLCNGIELLNCDNRNFLTQLSEKPNLYVYSPPYNIGSKSDKKITDRKLGGYDAKSFRSITDYPDQLDEADYQQQQIDSLNLCSDNLAPNGVIVYNHKNRNKKGRLISPYSWILKSRLEVFAEIIWNRKSTHENGRTHPRQIDERLYVLCNKNDSPYYAPKFDKEMKNETTIWTIDRQMDNEHNAAYPLELAARAIEYFSKKGDLVCDIYSGSGTTMCAAYLQNRNFVGCEIQRKYYKQSIERFNRIFKQESKCA